MLVELRRLLAPEPPVQPPATPEQQPQPATPPANILDIQPISPPTVCSRSTIPGTMALQVNSDWPPVDGGWIPPPPFIYAPPVIMFVPQNFEPMPPPPKH